MSLLFTLLLSCGLESHSAASPEVHFSGMVLEDAQGNRVQAVRAEMDPEGRGQGWEVDATLRVSSEGTTDSDVPVPELIIEAERSQWDLKARTVRFEGEVRATRDEMLLRCERLDVQLGQGDRIEHAVAVGGVRVEHQSRVATGDRADLFASKGELVITGSPTLEDGGNSLAGKRITLWLDDDRLDCDACTLVMESPGIGEQ